MSGPEIPGLDGLFKMDGLMRMAQDLQQKLQTAQGELTSLTATAASGGGMVTGSGPGQHRLLSLRIEPEVATSESLEMLQDLTVAAINMAMERVDGLIAQRMSEATGGLPLPFNLADLGR